MLKRKTKRLVKRLMARATRRALKMSVEINYTTAKIVGRHTCGHYVERRGTKGGLLID
ncbi:hypothetical protein AN618_18820 [Fervidicola ferrireducens]|uniref:Uncharacterized protein n=1 Tax=Fervidicola ferrireducens TaxID=520764 RepID=A0A140L4N4_9FIRM|nr:hypothetical protein [Fervidicola ferrireducens]KXG75509.1 hypothetical protein AN618_18820 [Fervidicola ferrireducens]